MLCAIMLAPFVLSLSASLKTTEEASAIPPTYLTHHLSLESYHRLWSYQAGLPIYLANSGETALLTILLSASDDSGRTCVGAISGAG
jgi:multiple sugar transport system permease protein